jgi:neutral amino acid transport system permease protein
VTAGAPLHCPPHNGGGNQGRTELRILLRAAALVLLLFALLAPAAASGQEETEEPAAEDQVSESAEALRGTLTDAEGPVEGVSIVVRTAEGEEVGEAVTDAEGGWILPLPGPGDYAVEVQTDTLPEGVDLRNPDRNPLEINVRPAQTRNVLFPLGESTRETRGRGSRFVSLTVDGIKFGLIIGMTAIGLSLIFGTTGLVNFAHGELVAFGAIVAWFLNTQGPAIPLIGAAIVAVAAGALLAGGLEKGLWKPLRRRGTGLISMLVVSIGLSLFLRHILLFVFGGRSLPYREYRTQTALALGPLRITPRDLAIVILSIIVLVGVGLLLNRTKIGKAMRAVADNRDLAESSGIDVQRVIFFVWMLGGALAALGGVFQGMSEAVNWNMGFLLLLLMFAGVILGGIGTAYGALVGSLFVGLITQLSTLWFPSELKTVFALLALAIVLLFRPQGILGRAERIG